MTVDSATPSPDLTLDEITAQLCYLEVALEIRIGDLPASQIIRAATRRLELQRREIATLSECKCGPAECRRILSGGFFVPPPGWVYAPDLQADADRYRFLRQSEADMGPKAEEAHAEMWLSISKKGIDKEHMDEAIDTGRKAFCEATEADDNE